MVDQQRFQQKQWGQIVARAWADDEFKARLMESPKTVMRDYGLELAPGVRVTVVEDTAEDRHFILPPNPAGDLSEEELSPVAGADSFSGGCGCRRCGGCGCGRCGCGCDSY